MARCSMAAASGTRGPALLLLSVAVVALGTLARAKITNEEIGKCSRKSSRGYPEHAHAALSIMAVREL